MTNDSTGQFTVTVILTRPTSYLLCWMSLKTFQNYRNTTHHPELILSLSPDSYSSPCPLTCLESQSVESDGKQITKIFRTFGVAKTAPARHKSKKVGNHRIRDVANDSFVVFMSLAPTAECKQYHGTVQGSSPPVGKLLLSSDSDCGLESRHTSVGTTVEHKQTGQHHSCTVHCPTSFKLSLLIKNQPSYLAYLVSEDSPKKIGAFWENWPLETEQNNIFFI